MEMSPDFPERDSVQPSETYRLVRPVEDPPPPPSRASQPNPLRRLLIGDLPLETETTWFILVNLVDFFVTYWLLMGGGGRGLRFIESNPVARYFIESWGPVKGMLGFKLGIVTFVCLVAQLIAIKRVDLGRKVLLFGTLATGFVVAYSLALWLRHA